jgi:hypothetical protein
MSGVLDHAARAVLGWSARLAAPSRRDWVEALRGELAAVDGGGGARLLWALGGLSLAFSTRRRSLQRPWYSWPALLRTSAFGLALAAVLVVGIVWSNVVVPSHESDDEYTMWYLVFYVGLLGYFFVSGLVASRPPNRVVTGMWAGAATAVLVALIVLVTFVVIDNLFLDIVMTQPDKLNGFRHSGLTSERDYVNQGLLAGLVGVPLVLGAFGAGLGALGGAVRERLDRRRSPITA